MKLCIQAQCGQGGQGKGLRQKTDGDGQLFGAADGEETAAGGRFHRRLKPSLRPQKAVGRVGHQSAVGQNSRVAVPDAYVDQRVGGEAVPIFRQRAGAIQHCVGAGQRKAAGLVRCENCPVFQGKGPLFRFRAGVQLNDRHGGLGHADIGKNAPYRRKGKHQGQQKPPFLIYGFRPEMQSRRLLSVSMDILFIFYHIQNNREGQGRILVVCAAWGLFVPKSPPLCRFVIGYGRS